MTLVQLFKNVWPFVRPYGWLVFAALFLTLIGSFTAQVNALILKYTVDEVNELIQQGAGLEEGINILIPSSKPAPCCMISLTSSTVYLRIRALMISYNKEQ